MKNKYIHLLAVIVFIAAAFSGCANDTDKSIAKLGGSDSERTEAISTLMSIPGSRKDLEAALMDTKKYNAKVRKNVALLIGQQASISSDESAAAALEKALAVSEKEVKLEIVNALDAVPGDKGIESLRRAAEDKDAEVGKLAYEKLAARAKGLMADADKTDISKSKIKFLSEALSVNPCNSEVSAKLADLYREESQAEEAKKAENACGTIVSKMYLAWPFPGDFEKTQIDVAKFNPGEQLKAEDGSPVLWNEYEAAEGETVVDMRSVTAGEDMDGDYSTYAAFKIIADAAKDVNIRLGADTQAMLWVNGAVGAKLTDKENADYTIEKSVKTSLKKGDNLVIIKITGGTSRSRFRVRISVAGGGEPKGVKLAP